MMLSDYHMHTEFSLDSGAVPEEMAEAVYEILKEKTGIRDER